MGCNAALPGRGPTHRLLTNVDVLAYCLGVVVEALCLGRQVIVEFQVPTLLSGPRLERVVVDVEDLASGS